jgi:hypothetical protein
MEREPSQSLQGEGEPAKRYGFSHGDFVDSWDTATECLREYQNYERLIRPVIDKNKKHPYRFRDGTKDITLDDLKRDAAAEAKATTKTAKD